MMANLNTDWRLILSVILVFIEVGKSWRAVPANQAHYAVRSRWQDEDTYVGDEKDELLPRDTLNNIYKFGWCTKDIVTHQYLRKSVNITFPTWQSTHVNYIYLLAKKHTKRFRSQCVVMKMYVPKKFMFYKSRLPMYYCQGTIVFLMMNTINRYEIHEFYLGKKLQVPANFVFEFYHFNKF